jgi:peptidoglycan hydrolase-like amidase
MASDDGNAAAPAHGQRKRGGQAQGPKARAYRGQIYIAVDPQGELAVVNVLGVEEVLRGVVPSELFASAPLAALKAQAVASRNTLLAKLSKRHHIDPFHLCSETHCQVYTGTARQHPRADLAVASTRGQALFWGEHLVDAAYSANCGGHTEDAEVVWGTSTTHGLRGHPDLAPALFASTDVTPDARRAASPTGGPKTASVAPASALFSPMDIGRWVYGQPDAYCARSSFAQPEKFRWRKRLDQSTLNALVERRFPSIGPVLDLRVLGRGPGGRARSLLVVGRGGSREVRRELPIRRLFGGLNSGAFVMEKRHDAGGRLSAVTFVGAGWGHGVGMCQVGAIGRAEEGLAYTEILSHYFEGAELVTLY